MKICQNCDLEEKISECCSSHPETGKTKLMKVDGEIYRCCINLDESGACMEYQRRPEECKEHECYKVNETDLCDLFYD